MKLRFSENVIVFILNSDLEKLRKLTIQSLAEEFEYNWSYFSSKFKKETQMLVSEYIKNELLRRANILINQEDSVPIYEISRRVGFNKSVYFRKLFKKKYGITPGNLHKIKKSNKFGS
jgi:two-component system, response regulator YesN